MYYRERRVVCRWVEVVGFWILGREMLFRVLFNFVLNRYWGFMVFFVFIDLYFGRMKLVF